MNPRTLAVVTTMSAALAGCAPSPTTIELRIDLAAGVAIDQLVVVTGADRHATAPTDALRLIVPDAWAGTVVSLRLEGMQRGALAAVGTVDVTPVIGSEVAATVGLADAGTCPHGCGLVSVDRVGGGTVVSTPAGISCGTACERSFPSGTTVTLTATPDPGSDFYGWKGGPCDGAAGPCSFDVTAATFMTARFVVAGDTCANPIDLTAAAHQPLGASVLGGGVPLGNDVEPGVGCTGFDVERGTEMVYAVTAAAGERIDAIVVPADAGTSVGLYLLDTCTPAPASCLAFQDDGTPGDFQLVSFDVTTAGTYYVVVDSLDAGLGAYELDVTAG